MAQRYAGIPPIIVTGMHRSGTSIVSRVLEDFGVLMGARKSPNNEARLFQELNKWMMAQAGGRWDAPAATQYLLRDSNNLALIEDYVRMLFDSPRSAAFLGPLRYARCRGLSRLAIPWGWKDPRNTFTLPVWLRLFPDAKVVHVERHGVDVAQSLRVRHGQTYKRRVREYRILRPLYVLKLRTNGFVDSPRCSTLEGGFDLWEEYMVRGRKLSAELEPARLYVLRYEDLLSEPEEQLAALAEFCDVSPDSSEITETAQKLNHENAYAYRRSPELQSFAVRVSDRLFDYSA